MVVTMLAVPAVAGAWSMKMKPRPAPKMDKKVHMKKMPPKPDHDKTKMDPKPKAEKMDKAKHDKSMMDKPVRQDKPKTDKPKMKMTGFSLSRGRLNSK
jgi:hypothetical protein